VCAYARVEATNFAQKLLLAFTRALAVAALLSAAAAFPAHAKKNHEPATEPTKKTIPDPKDGQPMTLIISLRDQKIDIYRGTLLIATSKVSTGMRGYTTKPGIFSILEKQRYHHSNMYSAAPMPWMQRLTWSGTALHGGVVPGFPASHGCIRLPFSFAPKLFQITSIGDNVIVALDGAEPNFIEHPSLFQPLPSSTQSVVLNVEPVVSLDEGSETNGAHPALSAITAGAKAVATAATQLHTAAPLRILITRQTKRDRVIDLQIALRALGYLKVQKLDGTLGKPTVAAIKAFQKDQGLPMTGEFTEDLVKKVFKIAGRAEPPEGRLFVRSDFREVFSTPIAFRDPHEPLGTHLYTAMKFAPGDTKVQWIAMSVEGSDPSAALDRIQIPDDVRQKISERLTPGTSLIIAEKSMNSAILPKGGDFLIAINETHSIEPEKSKFEPRAKIKQAKAKKSHTRVARTKKWRRNAPYYSYNFPLDVRGRRLFWRWQAR
jgi:peptidoglycan hydrolase-like protein with peptidoglycan-binding domain